MIPTAPGNRHCLVSCSSHQHCYYHYCYSWFDLYLSSAAAPVATIPCTLLSQHTRWLTDPLDAMFSLASRPSHVLLPLPPSFKPSVHLINPTHSRLCLQITASGSCSRFPPLLPMPFCVLPCLRIRGAFCSVSSVFPASHARLTATWGQGKMFPTPSTVCKTQKLCYKYLWKEVRAKGEKNL